jgi:hypothetical protein
MTGEREDVRTGGAANQSAGEPSGRPLYRPTADPVGVAIGSIGTGATAGAAVVTFGLLVFRDRLNESLPLVVFAGILTAALTAWLLADTLAGEAWRRGVTAALAVFAGLLLAFLSAPADRLAGRIGLTIYAVLLAAAAVWGARYTRQRARS